MESKNKILIFLCSVIFFNVVAGAAFAGKTRSIQLTVREADLPPKTVRLYDNMTAVIIGIDIYENLPASDYLAYAVKDAKGMEEVLRDRYPFGNIVTLYNQDATKENIMKVLQGDLATAGPDDAVLIYHAGHGITRSTAQGDLGYLIPYDGSLAGNEMYKNISMQQIKSDVSPLIPAKHVLFIIDACFSGLLLDKRAVRVEPSRSMAYLQEITQEPVRQIITAGGKGEEVLDTGGLFGHSVFTGRLIQALKKNNDYITAKALGLDIQRKVYGDAAAKGHKQRPLVGEFYGVGDFVFVPDFEKLGEKADHALLLKQQEIAKLEADLERLNSYKKSAGERQEKEKLREIEREKLLKESALEQARLGEQAARREAEIQLKLEEEAKRMDQEVLKSLELAEKSEEARKQRDKEQEERLASLTIKAEKMRNELKRPEVSFGIKEAIAELKRLDQLMGKIKTDYEEEKNRQITAVDKHYTLEIKKIEEKKKSIKYTKEHAEKENLEPWDKMFETREDYEARVKKFGSRFKDQGLELDRVVERFQKEVVEKKAEIEEKMKREVRNQLLPLEQQKKSITSQKFTVGHESIQWNFSDYDLKTETFAVSGIIEDIFGFEGDMRILKTRARSYYKNPGLLVASAELGLSSNVRGITLVKFSLLGPKSDQYFGDNFSENYFKSNEDGTVSDMKTGLMWATEDNGKDINWQNAKSWAENYKGGGYTDWRLPTQDELAGIYDKSKENRHGYRVNRLIGISGCCLWASEIRGSEAANFDFDGGPRYWNHQSFSRNERSLPVRIGN